MKWPWTQDAIQTIYGASVKSYSLRRQAIACLTEPSPPIIAYSTDHILLQGILKEHSDKLKGYVIEPRLGNLTYEKYGVVIYGDTPDKGFEDSINSWIKEKGVGFINRKSNELSIYEFTIENDVSRMLWRPIERFYRVNIPILLASFNAFFLIFVALASILIFFALLTHQLVVKILAKIFPGFFEKLIEIRKALRRKGDEVDNKIIKSLGSIGLVHEEAYSAALHEHLNKVDDYDVSQLLDLQLRIAKYVKHLENEKGLKYEEARSFLVEDIAGQMKHNPRTRKALDEWVKSGSESFIDTFSNTFGRELATRFLNIVISPKDS